MTSGAALVDGHVHLHACYGILEALDAAARNLDDVRSRLRLSGETSGILWLVEHRDEGASDRLLAATGRDAVWQADESDGAILRLQHVDQGNRLTVVFGRQIRTAEDLEVLVVGTMESTPSDRPLEETVESWMEQDVLVMLPWGFGKWTGVRGKTIARAYEKYSAQGLRLADTRAHSRIRHRPDAFARSIAAGNPVLCGSDPFPFADQVQAIGRYGFVLENIPATFVWSDLRDAVGSLQKQPLRFGRPMRITEFARLQGKMQLRKRFGTGGGA